MSPAGEVAIAIMAPLVILGLFAIHPISVLCLHWQEREQRRRDRLARIKEPPETDDDEIR